MTTICSYSFIPTPYVGFIESVIDLFQDFRHGPWDIYRYRRIYRSEISQPVLVANLLGPLYADPVLSVTDPRD